MRAVLLPVAPFQQIIRRGKRRRPPPNPSPPARPTLCGESVLHAKQTCCICGPKFARMTHWPGKGMDKWQIGGGGKRGTIRLEFRSSEIKKDKIGRGRSTKRHSFTFLFLMAFIDYFTSSRQIKISVVGTFFAFHLLIPSSFSPLKNGK